MIPKLIHYCWFGGKPMPKDVIKNIESCKRENPGYIIKIWTEENFNLGDNEYCREAYESKKWAFVSDYVRLKVLYDFGGIYMDTDVEVKKGFDDLLNYKAFSGFEGENRIPTGTIGAEPNNQWVKYNLDYYNGLHFIQPDGSFNMTTNVETITRITKAYYPIVLKNSFQNLGDVVFLPFDWLCAKDLSTGIIKETKNTYTIHHFAGSWLEGKKKYLNWMTNHHLAWLIRMLVFVKRRFAK